MECEEELLFEAANALLLLSRSPPPDMPPAATINLYKPHPLPPAAMPATSIKNVLSFSLPSWGVRSRRSHHIGKLKRKQVEGPSPPTAVTVTCGHRSPDTPLDLGATSNPSSNKSDGFMCSLEIRPFKRLRTNVTSVPRFDAHIKRTQVEGPSPLTVVATTCGHRSPDTPVDLGAASNPSSIKRDGFMCSSEIRPFTRLRTRVTSVPRCDAHIKLKRKQVEGPWPLTAVAANCSHRSPHSPLDLVPLPIPLPAEAMASRIPPRSVDADSVVMDSRPLVEMTRVLFCFSWFQVSAAERSPLVDAVHPLQPIKQQGIFIRQNLSSRKGIFIVGGQRTTYECPLFL